MLKQFLKNAQEQQKLVDINIYDDEESIIGYITDVNDNYFTIKEIDKFGYSTGNTVYKIDSIKDLSSDNWYLQCLKIIIDYNNNFSQDNRVTIYKKGKELISHFNYLKENEIITVLFFDEDNYELGLILDFDKDFILLKDIGQDGSELGTTCYRINEMTGLKYNGLGEQKTRILYEAKHKLTLGIASTAISSK